MLAVTSTSHGTFPQLRLSARTGLEGPEQGLEGSEGQLWSVGRTTISFTSTAAGCSIAKAMARAIASGFLAQSFADGPDRELGAGVDGHGRRDTKRGCGSGGDEVAGPLRPENRQRDTDPVQHALHMTSTVWSHSSTRRSSSSGPGRMTQARRPDGAGTRPARTARGSRCPRRAGIAYESSSSSYSPSYSSRSRMHSSATAPANRGQVQASALRCSPAGGNSSGA